VRSAHVSGSTINRDLACLKKLFNRALSDGYCEINPVVGVEFDKEPLRALDYLNEKEAKALIKACDTIAIKTFVVLGLNTGMRSQELLSLRWADLNFEDNVITLRSTKKGGDDTVPMNNNVVTLLSGLERKSNFVIHKSDGNRYNNIRKSWNRVVKLAGITKCSPHILRHTFGTTLHRRGVDLLTLKELGRWSDLKLLERYVHVGKEHSVRKISVLDEGFGGDAFGDAVKEKGAKKKKSK
jgi:integrase